ARAGWCCSARKSSSEASRTGRSNCSSMVLFRPVWENEDMNIPIGYCTNVHAGTDLAQTRANLERHALAVKRRFMADRPMGVGLWCAASAARQLLEEQRMGEFASWLAAVGLVPYTLNGFPYGDFHQTVVKHQVYLPTWWEPARLEYTQDLIRVQHRL